MADATFESAMFPLGSVLLPGIAIPLHVFEERYRTMLEHVLASSDPTFGVTLIERGSEVGGDDTRASVGTLARVVEASRLPDGRYTLVAIGVERVRVAAWLPDDPFPRAELERWPDTVAPAGAADYDGVRARHRRLLATLSEAGVDGLGGVEIDDDPTLGAYQMAATMPIDSYDHYRVLCAASTVERVELIDELLAGVEEIVQHRFGG